MPCCNLWANNKHVQHELAVHQIIKAAEVMDSTIVDSESDDTTYKLHSSLKPNFNSLPHTKREIKPEFPDLSAATIIGFETVFKHSTTSGKVDYSSRLQLLPSPCSKTNWQRLF